MPEIGFAIEYNGMYYHSSNTTKYKDRQKIIQCQQKNYKLMIITNEEWKSDKNKTKTEIKATIDSLCNNL